MLFALLFIIAFLLGLGVYLFTRNWMSAVFVPMVLFVVSTLADQSAQDAWAFTLISGLPIVFFAGLLGAYVVQIRTVEPAPDEPSEEAKE